MLDPDPESEGHTDVADTFLDRLVAATREVIAERQAQAPLDSVREQARQAPAPRDFAGALGPIVGGSARLIAEVKRASPSKGSWSAEMVRRAS